MLTWPSKDPDEVLDYQVDWSAQILDDKISTSVFTLVTPGGVSIQSQSHYDKSATVWLTGGTEGAQVELLNRIVTQDGRTLDESITLAIASKETPDPVSGYVRPSVAQFMARYPVFANVPAGVVEGALNEAPVDNNWLERDYARAIMLWAAHTLTIEGYGATGDVENFLGRGVASVRSGSFSATFSEGAQRAAASGGYTGSRYGQRFYELLQQNRGGPVVVSSRPMNPYWEQVSIMNNGGVLPWAY